ncbi:MAG: hypothetical protein KAW84_04395 [Thermoplasmata archaeon]|nr:hypothetical protein [Thermoplasmata archaeon]
MESVLMMICEDIHKALEDLPLWREPSRELPENGLYFFYEAGEFNSHDERPRIVRVGNHPRSRNTLQRRLRTHYSGSKNASVFRKFLGGAIMRRRDPSHPCLKPAPGKGHWERQDEKTCPSCKPIEKDVSALLRSGFSFRCIEIVDMDLRNTMEKKLIATLSNCPTCGPSDDWLGKFAYSEKVVKSGLWNSNHVWEDLVLTKSELHRCLQGDRERL